MNNIDDVMVSTLTSRVVDCEFEPLLGIVSVSPC